MSKKKELESKGYKAYENEEIIVFWNSNMCQHVGECVKGNSSVFNPKNRPWIDLSKASSFEIASIIDRCPSKALQYELKDNVTIVFDEYLKKSIAYKDCKKVGECEISVSDSKWVIVHTEVNSNYQEQGIAKRLVECVIKEAREKRVKVFPLCSYAKKMMVDKEKYRDILLEK